MLDFCRREAVQLLIARCRVDDIRAAQAMEEAGFRLMDTWVRYVGPLLPPAAANGIREARPGDLDQIEAIARVAFHAYRGHYHADPRLDPAAADEVYVSWTRRCATGEAADVVLVAERDGRVAGFSALRMADAQTGELVLGAVHPASRGRGLYRAMSLNGMAWTARRGGVRFAAATHLSNLAAQKAWARLGMMPEAAAFTFHNWLF